MGTDQSITLDIPPLYCPIPSAIHPNHAELRRGTMRWLDRYGFCSDATVEARVRAINGAEFVARLTPGGDLERMQIFSDWAHLSLLFDDLYDSLPRPSAGAALARFAKTAVKVMRTFEAPDANLLDPHDPFTAPLRDLAGRTHRLASPVQMRRMIEAQRIWLSCVCWEIAHQTEGGSPPDLNDYTTLRMGTVGAVASSSWIEILNGSDDIPCHEFDSYRTRAIAEIAGTIVGMDQDLYSWGKDLWHRQHDGTVAVNFVSVIAHDRACSDREAMIHLVRMRDRLMSLFLELRDLALASAGPELTRYLTDLGHYIRGTLDWGLGAERYRTPDGASPHSVRISHTWSSSPSDASPDPIPGIPSIAWWWRTRDTPTTPSP
ncbi:hypothetical protein ACFWIA_12520 [Streptomyces sp. NPDC127068]|uniref:terpene synthase family protein n=1 Tax=Streptomyces sp. NPDC127068 TaxID=3347127 RepID=UPI00365F6870